MALDGPREATGPAIGGGRGGGAVVAAEVLGLVAMLIAVSGTCALLISAYHRVGPEPVTVDAVVVAAPAEAGPSAGDPVEAEIPAEPAPPVSAPMPRLEPLAPIEPEVDPTAEALARIEAEREALAAEAGRKIRRASSLASELEARGGLIDLTLSRASEADRERAALAAEADRLEAERQLAALERDVLERQRDRAVQGRREAVERPGYAILPYRGPSGTWRRPIPVECRDGSAAMEPGGMRFSMVELMGLSGRTSPFGGAVRRLASILEARGAPGGERVEPYVLFVVRPDGIRPFYEARSALDAIGVPYGYELVDQDWEIEYPDWDDPTIWDSLETQMADPALLAEVDPVGAGPPGPGGPIGQGGADPDGGTFPPRPPSPSEMPDAMRSFGDLLPADLGPAAGAGSGFGGRPGLGPMAGESGGRASESGRGPGRGSPTPGGPVGRDIGDEPAGPGAGGLAGLDGGDPAPGASPHGPGRFGDPSGIPGGAPGPGEPASPDRVRFAGDAGAGSIPPALPGDRGPTPPGTSRPGSTGGTGLGRLDGGPESIPAGGLGRVVGGLASRLGASGVGPGDIPGGSGAGGSDAAAAAGAGAGSSPREAGEAGAVGSSASGPGGPPGGAGSGSGGAGRRIEMVVACGPKGVTIHPGGYKIGEEVIAKDDGRLVQTLRAVLSSRRRREPSASPVPSLRFLVEPGGYGLYWDARAQVELAGLGWPIEWQATERRTFTIFGSERW
ncbi:hypothetical protein [Tautonia plasticadhaerens]|uniref:Uncharacterized protein n=1 Tax=Tautonia plasticadhaerens TaxID=2527974 RepID=A0A518H085_9BACT|nr:hypothetical protein [Tautonia plasticadhaerens]QDV34254.1 hypothetical protein ElP_21390 [Tautonia plasticadhaerens]